MQYFETNFTLNFPLLASCEVLIITSSFSCYSCCLFKLELTGSFLIDRDKINLNRSEYSVQLHFQKKTSYIIFSIFTKCSNICFFFSVGVALLSLIVLKLYLRTQKKTCMSSIMFDTSLVMRFIITLRLMQHLSTRFVIFSKYGRESINCFSRCDLADLKLRKLNSDFKFVHSRGLDVQKSYSDCYQNQAVYPLQKYITTTLQRCIGDILQWSVNELLFSTLKNVSSV